VRTQQKVLLLGAGIGITPLRSILEGLDSQTRDVVVVHRAHSSDQLFLAPELSDLAARKGGRYVTVTGPRTPGRHTWLPATAAHLTDAQALTQLVPDVAERDVFLCGAPGWMDAARQAALESGVPADHIHLERFEY
jgi:ferredoxin-NADP reductase